MSVIHITSEQEFQEKVVQFTGLSIVDFRAERCGPCRMPGPIMEQLAEENASKQIQIIKVNVDENPEVSAKYGIRNIPTVIFLKNGEIKDKVVGAVPKSTLAAKLDALL